MIDNKKIKTTESLQIIEIEKLIYHHSVTKKNIKNENTIIFLVFLLLM